MGLALQVTNKVTRSWHRLERDSPRRQDGSKPLVHVAADDICAVVVVAVGQNKEDISNVQWLKHIIAHARTLRVNLDALPAGEARRNARPGSGVAFHRRRAALVSRGSDDRAVLA